MHIWLDIDLPVVEIIKKDRKSGFDEQHRHVSDPWTDPMNALQSAFNLGSALAYPNIGSIAAAFFDHYSGSFFLLLHQNQLTLGQYK